jgi:hypothetical protein
MPNSKAKAEPKTKKKMGRPKGSVIKWDDKDIRVFQQLCRCGCTEVEVAGTLGVSIMTLKELINRHLYEDITGKKRTANSEKLTFLAAYEKYHAAGRASLRGKLYEKALKGGTAELIFLAKNQLGMADNPNVPTGQQTVILRDIPRG